MAWLFLAIGVSAAWPLMVAWRATKGSTIRHALAWAWLAWLAWLSYGWMGGVIPAYAGLTTTAAAGIAVFGARRPGVAAWNFVVIGLLAVLWLPWAEGLITGADLHLDKFRYYFLAVLLTVIFLNYLPTRMASAFGIAALCCIALSAFVFEGPGAATFHDTEQGWGNFILGCAGWTAWGVMREPRKGSPTDQLWARFRDRFGAVWALRLREQFNAAAHNAGWPVRLNWFGMTPKTIEVDPEWHAALVALQKRFGMEDTSVITSSS